MLQRGTSIKRAGGGALHSRTDAETCGAHAGLTLTQKGTVITARGPCASPRKLYYTLQCGGMFRHTTFRCRKRCCCSLLFTHLGGFSFFFHSGQGFCTYRSVVFLAFALSFSMRHCHLIDFLSDQVVKLHPGCLLTTKIVFKYHRHESFSLFPQKVRRQNIPSSD